MTLPGSPRLPYDRLPAGLRTAVDDAIGSPVVAVSPRTGGFSPGPAVVVTCADGGRANACGRRDAAEPGHPGPAARRGSSGGRAAGRAAGPPAAGARGVGRGRRRVGGAGLRGRRRRAPAAALDGGDRGPGAGRGGRLHRSVTPCPLPGLRPAAELLSGDLACWQALAADPLADLHPWEASRPDWLVAVPDRLTAGGGLAGDTLVHLDVRADNLLFADDGRVVLLDWAWACQGAAWVDPVLLALDTAVHGGLDPEALVAGLPTVAAADPRDVTDLLAGLTGMWALTTRRPAPLGLPTLRAFQRQFHDAALDWVRARVGE